MQNVHDTLKATLDLTEAEADNFIAFCFEPMETDFKQEIKRLSEGTDEYVVQCAKDAARIVELHVTAGRHHLEYQVWLDQVEELENKADMIQEAIFYANAALAALTHNKTLYHVRRVLQALDILKAHTANVNTLQALPVNFIAEALNL